MSAAAHASPHSHFNMLDVATFANGHPHELYDQIRQETPVFRHQGSDIHSPFWVLFGYEDIKAVSQDGENFSSTGGFKVPTDNRAKMDPEIARTLGRFMLSMDNPEHQLFRNIVADAFLPSALKLQEQRVANSINRLMETLADRDEVEFVTEVGAKVPIQTVCAVLGLPEEEEDRVFDFTNAVFLTDDPEFAPTLDVANARYLEIFDYARKVMADRRANPRNDLLTRIAFAEIDGKPISEVEQVSFFSNLLAAGNETTRTTFAGCMIALSRFPDVKQRLVAEPDLIARAIPELLRWISPVYHMARTAKRDVVIGGQKIAQGERVAMLYGAGNHDPLMFENPHQVMIDRPNTSRHLTFGWGIHHCLGQRLGIMQLRLMLEALLAHFPNSTVIGEPAYIATNFVAAIKKLRVRLRP